MSSYQLWGEIIPLVLFLVTTGVGLIIYKDYFFWERLKKAYNITFITYLIYLFILLGRNEETTDVGMEVWSNFIWFVFALLLFIFLNLINYIMNKNK